MFSATSAPRVKRRTRVRANVPPATIAMPGARQQRKTTAATVCDVVALQRSQASLVAARSILRGRLKWANQLSTGNVRPTANLGSSACECECFLRFVAPVHGFSRAWQARVRVPPDIFVRLHRHRQRTLYAELVRVSQAPVPWRSRSFTSFLLCFSGNYCPAASGSPTPCPAGTFGSTTTLSTSACACGVGSVCSLLHGSSLHRQRTLLRWLFVCGWLDVNDADHLPYGLR